MSDDLNLGELRGAGPKPGFSDEVMRQIAARPLPRPSFWQRLLRPRELTIRVTPARLAVAAMALAALALIGFVERPRPTVLGAQVVAPNAPVLIRFTLSAPEAHAVSLAGDFNGWRPDAAPAERGPDGVWRVTLPLGPGSWSYSFVVDGRFVEDPLAQAWREDGFGGRNAVLRVD